MIRVVAHVGDHKDVIGAKKVEVAVGIDSGPSLMGTLVGSGDDVDLVVDLLKAGAFWMNRDAAEDGLMPYVAVQVVA